jgi:hypothetical protein
MNFDYSIEAGDEWTHFIRVFCLIRQIFFSFAFWAWGTWRCGCEMYRSLKGHIDLSPYLSTRHSRPHSIRELDIGQKPNNCLMDFIGFHSLSFPCRGTMHSQSTKKTVKKQELKSISTILFFSAPSLFPARRRRRRRRPVMWFGGRQTNRKKTT